MRNLPSTLNLTQLFVWVCFRTPEAVAAARPTMMPLVIEAPIDLRAVNRSADAEEDVFAPHKMLFPAWNRFDQIEDEVKTATNRGALTLYGAKAGARGKIEFPLSDAHIFCFRQNALRDTGSGEVWNSIYVTAEECRRVWPPLRAEELGPAATNFKRKPGRKPGGTTAKQIVEKFLVARYNGRPQLSSSDLPTLVMECLKTDAGKPYGFDHMKRAFRLYLEEQPR